MSYLELLWFSSCCNVTMGNFFYAVKTFREKNSEYTQPSLEMSWLVNIKFRLGEIRIFFKTNRNFKVNFFFSYVINVPLDHWATFIVLSKKGLLLHSSFVKAQAQWKMRQKIGPTKRVFITRPQQGRLNGLIWS